ncbi:MAG: 16S rRNA (cytidine(1402)-2'-O)-methyltransferase [Chloroflexota bacterium]|nr:16S rRNA (cytidine(1402)-2'-O)-methyltransferase [Chloroflexota bacterium]
MSGTLYLVAVPIGNPRDITLRALDTLRDVDLVAAEDTRHFATLARAHGIHARTVSLHDHNEVGRIPELLARLRGGGDVALVSDAGTPLVSDPGYRLVGAALAEGLAVTSLPGASAITTSLAAAGLPPVPFRFCGFPPRAAGPRRAFYARLADEPATLVVYEAPHRLLDSLRDARTTLGDRPACLARNLTKPHERFQRAPLDELIAALEAEGAVRGECTLLLGGADGREGTVDLTLAERASEVLLDEGTPPRAVVALLTSVLGLPRRRAYELAHRARPIA